MTAADKLGRLARAYDAEIVPGYAGRFGAFLLRTIGAGPLAGARLIVEAGCATGHLTGRIAATMGKGTRLVSVDDREPFVSEARRKRRAAPGAKVEIVCAPLSDLPIGPRAADLVLSNLAFADAVADEGPVARRALMAEIRRVLAPGGRLALTAPLRGTWAEVIDLLGAVLRDSGKNEGAAALERHAATAPEASEVADWLGEAGFEGIELAVERWQILFKSARELFFAPLIELGPLPDWKQLVGRGDEMQDAFFFTKEAIDTYFKGRPFAVTIVAAAVSGRIPA